jgi:hypothetical protein
MKRRSALLLLCVAFSCSGKEPAPPQGVIPPDRFADLYTDLLRNDSPGSVPPGDTLRVRQGIDSLLRVYATTREGVRTSVSWYNQDVVRWRLIMDSVNARLDRRQSPRPSSSFPLDPPSPTPLRR